MNITDINSMIRWAVDTDGVKFAKEIYQRDEPDSYTRDKFRGMQNNFINWVANLDNKHKQRLADAINRTTIDRHKERIRRNLELADALRGIDLKDKMEEK